MRTPKTLVVASVLLYPATAWMSVVAKPKPLAHVVEASSTVVLAERLVPSKGDEKEVRYRVLETLYDDQGATVAGEIVVSSPNQALYDAIAEDMKAGRPYPFPIVDSYEGARAIDPTIDKKMILFLRRRGDPPSSRYLYTVEDAWDAPRNRKRIEVAIAKARTRKSPAVTPPGPGMGKEESERAIGQLAEAFCATGAIDRLRAYGKLELHLMRAKMSQESLALEQKRLRALVEEARRLVAGELDRRKVDRAVLRKLARPPTEKLRAQITGRMMAQLQTKCGSKRAGDDDGPSQRALFEVLEGL